MRIESAQLFTERDKTSFKLVDRIGVAHAREIRVGAAMAEAQGRGEAREVFGVCVSRAELLPFAQRPGLFPKGRAAVPAAVGHIGNR